MGAGRGRPVRLGYGGLAPVHGLGQSLSHRPVPHCFIAASDYPHEQAAATRHALWSFQARTDVSQRAKEQILRDNSKALYGM
jgi:hypothetical protein